MMADRHERESDGGDGQKKNSEQHEKDGNLAVDWPRSLSRKFKIRAVCRLQLAEAVELADKDHPG